MSAAGAERRAHFAVLAAGSKPDASVAAALDAAAASARSRAANATAAQFAVQAVTFTPAQETSSLAVRRIRAAELLFLAGEVRESLEQLEALDLDELATTDLERALPLLLDMTGLVHGESRARQIASGAMVNTGPDPRRRALVLALASDIQYGVRGARRAAATEAIRCAWMAGSVANPSLHRALVNLAICKVTGAEGLDTELLERARRLEDGLPALRLYDTADLNLGLWSRYVEDLDTARVALGRSIERARQAGEDFDLRTFLSYLAATEVLAGDYAAAATALRDAKQVSAWHDWPPSPWDLEPLCDLKIAEGDLAGAAALANEHLPDEEGSPLASRFIGACLRGRVCTWENDAAGAVGYLETAAAYAEECEWNDPAVRHRLDPLLAEGYVELGRLDEARAISARLARDRRGTAPPRACRRRVPDRRPRRRTGGASGRSSRGRRGGGRCPCRVTAAPRGGSQPAHARPCRTAAKGAWKLAGVPRARARARRPHRPPAASRPGGA